MTRTAQLWCAALVTWGVAAVLGVFAAVFLPELFPPTSSFAAPLKTTAPLTNESKTPPGAAKHAVSGGAVADVSPGARQRAADAAVLRATSQGWRSGIAVVDLETGQTTLAGDARGYFRAESTMKLFLASRLLVEGRLTGPTEDAARRMVALSDDQAANSLYAAGGGDAVITWVSARYAIPDLGVPPVQGPGQWGSTLVTPRGMAAFLYAVHQDGKTRPWLLDAMTDMSTLAADGTNQVFGLRSADPAAVVKQGWGGGDGSGTVTGTPSVGYVDRGRYAVAIMTTRMPGTSVEAAQTVVSEQAKILLPDGRMPRL
ncbi:serine hydrolase [Austwickia chelonae]|uniref:serine hydrolase n=1 Tax=Austwickia chelonae TaxID=100225 RepID=UPI000E21C545|nr:serine hydrolase [Austwickia chelonae]